jgi:hypothetical protein
MVKKVGDADREQPTNSLNERFLGVLLEEYGSADVQPTVRADIVWLAEKVVVEYSGRAQMVRFWLWQNGQAQDDLRRDLIHLIDERDIYSFTKQEAIADRLMDLGRANKALIAKRGTAA